MHDILASLLLQQDQGVYQSKVRDMISKNNCRLIVNINDLRRRNEARAARFAASLPYIQLHSSAAFYFARLLLVIIKL